MRPGLPDVDIDTTIFRPATYIETSIDKLTMSLMVGCVLLVDGAVRLPVRMARCAD